MLFRFIVTVAVIVEKSLKATGSFTDEELAPTDEEHDALRGRYLPRTLLDAPEIDALRIPALGGKCTLPVLIVISEAQDEDCIIVLPPSTKLTMSLLLAGTYFVDV